VNSPALAGLPSTAVWRIKHHFNFLFEIFTQEIAGLLPPQLRPVEPTLGLSRGCHFGSLREALMKIKTCLARQAVSKCLR
jgi:hypothetical protein